VFSQVELLLSVGTSDCDMSDLLCECSDTSYILEFEEEFHSLNIDISNTPPFNFKIVNYNKNSSLATDCIEQLTDLSRTLKFDVLILSES
jgi:hypothetical protein